MKFKISPIKGRGSASNIDNRYSLYEKDSVDDGWQTTVTEQTKIRTEVYKEHPKTIITRNQSPDIPFTQSINPYRGCEHGCSYCYARPAHAYVDLSPGIDFETKLFVKHNAAELLKKELTKPNYTCSPIALGSNTDPYQPIDRQWQITRDLIKVLNAAEHPLTIVTKSSLVERDIDLLAPMAEKQLVQVFISVTTLKNDLAMKLEPRATAPHSRLKTLRALSNAGIPTGVMFAPVIPVINDTEMESVLTEAAKSNVNTAAYVMLRLPLEVKTLFRQWLELHEPLKAKHVMSMVQDIRDGKDNDSQFGSRMTGSGTYAEIISQRFKVTCKRLGLNRQTIILNTKLFKPSNIGDQMQLF